MAVVFWDFSEFLSGIVVIAKDGEVFLFQILHVLSICLPACLSVSLYLTLFTSLFLSLSLSLFLSLSLSLSLFLAAMQLARCRLYTSWNFSGWEESQRWDFIRHVALQTPAVEVGFHLQQYIQSGDLDRPQNDVSPRMR